MSKLTIAENFYDQEVLTAMKCAKNVSKREQNLDIHQISRQNKAEIAIQPEDDEED